jgi:hypothetical protein
MWRISVGLGLCQLLFGSIGYTRVWIFVRLLDVQVYSGKMHEGPLAFENLKAGKIRSNLLIIIITTDEAFEEPHVKKGRAFFTKIGRDLCIGGHCIDSVPSERGFSL